MKSKLSLLGIVDDMKESFKEEQDSLEPTYTPKSIRYSSLLS